jgi:hypothetical protein
MVLNRNEEDAMHHTVKFAGTETEMIDQAWQATLDYLGDMINKLAQIKEEQQTEGNAKQAEQVAKAVGFFWGIEGYYPIKALEQFLLGERTI